MRDETTEKRFSDALNQLISRIQTDRSILAVILCGSLAHDTVWDKSDIDLALITLDNSRTEPSHISLYEDGVNIHAFLMPRAEFRKSIEGAVRNSFIHSLLAKGRLLYTHDETIAEICSRQSEIGERDTQLQLLSAATQALGPVDKAHKWFVTRGDLDYTALWILYAATPLARIEVIGAGLLADREVIPQALTLNPEFFTIVYTGMLNAKKTRKTVEAALNAVDGYLAQRTRLLFGPILDHLREVAETRSATEIDNHFKRNFNIGGASMACEYLAHRGLIGKASTPVQLTIRSKVIMQEQAFVDLGGDYGGE
jgi:uncharacterized protein